MTSKIRRALAGALSIAAVSLCFDNAAVGYNSRLDADHDGIACEAH